VLLRLASCGQASLYSDPQNRCNVLLFFIAFKTAHVYVRIMLSNGEMICSSALPAYKKSHRSCDLDVNPWRYKPFNIMNTLQWFCGFQYFTILLKLTHQVPQMKQNH